MAIAEKFKPYPKYKDSGIEWIGDIPEGWSLKKIKHNTYVKGRIGWQGLKSDEFIDEGPFLVTGTDFNKGEINWGSCYHVSEERYNQDSFIQLKNEDLLITKDGTIGKTAIVTNLKGKACLNSGIFLTRPLRPDYISRFLYWLLNSDVFTNFIDYTKTGTTISHLYQNVFVEFPYPIPEIIEQSQIASFLDHETSRIDTLIVKKEKQIELLIEKRSALITHAVTKGLNPNTKMKDSGIEWIGEIPDGWEVIPIKRISKKIQTGTTPKTGNDNYFDGDIPWFTPEGFSENIKILNSPTKYVTEFALNDGEAKIFDDGSIYFVGIGATIGKVGIIAGEASCNQQINIIKIINGSPDYFYYQLKIIEKEIIKFASFTTLPILNQNKTGQLKVCVPTQKEQSKIAEYLDKETTKIDSLIEKIKLSIEKLKEFRTALISAAVTGKIDVRNEVSQ